MLPIKLSRWTVASALLPVVLTPVLWLVFGKGGLAAPLAAGTLTGILLWAYRRKVEALRRRMAREDGPSWDVAVNDVPVGTLSDAEYAWACLAPLQDWRVFCLQAVNVGRTVLRLVNSSLLAIPHLAFWGVVGWVIYAPTELFETIAVVGQARPDEMATLVGGLLRMLPVLMMGGFLVSGLICNAWFGLRNVFADRTAWNIRQCVGASSDGKITISREVNTTAAPQAITG